MKGDDLEKFMRRGQAAQKAVDEELKLTATIATGHCPDCGYRGFVLGPRDDARMVMRPSRYGEME